MYVYDSIYVPLEKHSISLLYHYKSNLHPTPRKSSIKISFQTIHLELILRDKMSKIRLRVTSPSIFAVISLHFWKRLGRRLRCNLIVRYYRNVLYHESSCKRDNKYVYLSNNKLWSFQVSS